MTASPPEEDHFLPSRKQVQNLTRKFAGANREQRISIIMLLADAVVTLSKQLGYPTSSILEFLIQQGYGYFKCSEILRDDDLKKILEVIRSNHRGSSDLHTHIKNLLKQTKSFFNQEEIFKIEDLLEQIQSDELIKKRKLDQGKKWLTFQLQRLLMEKSTDLDQVFELGNQDNPERLLELKNTHSELVSKYLHHRFHETRQKFQCSEGKWKNGREGLRSWITECLFLGRNELGMELSITGALMEHFGKYLSSTSAGSLLRSLRTTAGLSQNKCVKETNVCSRQHLSKIETGQVHTPSYQIVRPLGSFLSQTLMNVNRMDELSSEERSFAECCRQLPACEELPNLLREETIPHSTFSSLVLMSRWILELPELFLTDILLLNPSLQIEHSDDQSPEYPPESLAFLTGLHEQNRSSMLPRNRDVPVLLEESPELADSHRAGYLFGRMLQMNNDYPTNASGLQQTTKFENTDQIKTLMQLLEKWDLIRKQEGTEPSIFRVGEYKISSKFYPCILSGAGLNSPFLFAEKK